MEAESSPARQVRGIAATRQGRASSAALPCPTDFLQLPVTAGPQSPWIELAMADGTILRLPQQNLAALIAVLRVLRGEVSGPAFWRARHA